jgi:hypothetical protein
MKWLNQLGQKVQKIEPYIALKFTTGTKAGRKCDEHNVPG